MNQRTVKKYSSGAFPLFNFIAGCISLIFILTACPVNAQKSKEKLQADKQKIEKDIAFTNQLLSETKKNKQISLSQLIILNNKINQREELVNNISSEIEDIDGKIVNNSKETMKLSDQLKRLKEEYAKMIVFAYKNRNAFFRLIYIFASSDLNQAYLRMKYIQIYSQYRRKQAERIMGVSTQLVDKINLLKNIKTDKSTLLKTEEAEKLLLAQEKQEKNNAVKQLQKKEKDLANKIRQKEKEALKLQQSIETIIANEIKKATEKAKSAKKASTKTTTTTASTTKTGTKTTTTTAKAPVATTTSKELGLTDAEMTLSSSFAANKGKMPWPTEKGIVISTFGVHPHPVLSDIKVKNNGIDISTNTGARARAVLDGKVTGIVSVPGANKAIIIRHGEYLTVYSNLTDVYVKTGDNVKAKQSIGAIYTNTAESKTELHFEVWYGKTLTDPLGWLSPNR